MKSPLRDYASEAEKHCLLRIPDVKPQDCSIWGDHLPKNKSGDALRAGHEQIAQLDLESIQKQFEADCYKIAMDVSSFTTYADGLGKNKRTAQLAKICHLRAEGRRGSNAVVDWMETQCHHEVGLYSDDNATEAVKKAGKFRVIVFG